MKSEKTKTLIILAAILVVAAFFRLWQLNSIPPGFFRDVAYNGKDALHALQTGNFQVFYPGNTGREGLFINLVAFSFFIFGVKVWSIKVVAAICGILTVWGTYLAAKEIFLPVTSIGRAKSIALLSSFFLAVSFWHTLISRIGFRAIMVPFILTFAIYFLLRAFRTKNPLDFVVAGIFWGLGFYTYIAFRLAVIILAAILILKREQWRKVSLFLVVAFLVALPLGIYFLHNPQDFTSRAEGVSIFSQANPFNSFLSSLGAHLGMFNFQGDGNWRHNLAGSPMLFWPVGILFLSGIVLSIARFKKAVTAYSLLFVWFFAMLLPGVLTYSGIPHGLRTLGVLPVVCIFAAMAGIELYRWLLRRMNKKALIALCLLFLLFVTCSEFNKYFYVWAKDPNVGKAYSEILKCGNTS